jgi:hypothetical protein
MRLEKERYTVGQVARICGCAPRTVCQWCTRGQLPHYRLGVDGDRRILRPKLLRFLNDHGIPIGPVPTLWAIGYEDPGRGQLKDWLAASWSVESATVGAELGTLLATSICDGAVIDANTLGRGLALEVLTYLPFTRRPRPVVILAPEDAEGWKPDGATDTIPFPHPPGAIAKVFREWADGARPIRRFSSRHHEAEPLPTLPSEPKRGRRRPALAGT